jgi:hypothetical protein
MPNIRKLIDLIESHETLGESPEQVRAEIEKKIEKIPDESDLVDVLKFTNKFALKKDVSAFTTLRNYKDLVANVFLQALANANLDEATVKKFLQKLSTDGILNEKLLMTPGKVNTYTELIDQEWQTTFNLIKGDLFEKISGKIGEMGDVGKGEYLLDIISPHVNRRGAPGDLDVQGVKIELKAGESGRVGPAGSQSLVGRFQREFLPAVKHLVPASRLKQIPKDSTDLGKMFNLKQNMGGFTAFFGNAKAVKEALAIALKMHYPDYNVKAIANAVVDGAGNIDGQKLKAEMLKASFTVYRNAKEFDGIIIMDSAVTKFLYVNSPETMYKIAPMVTVSFPSWVETQSNAMKVTLGVNAGVEKLEVPSLPPQTAKKPSAAKKQEQLSQLAAKVMEYCNKLAAQYKVTDTQTIQSMVEFVISELTRGIEPAKIKPKLVKKFNLAANLKVDTPVAPNVMAPKPGQSPNVTEPEPESEPGQSPTVMAPSAQVAQRQQRSAPQAARQRR